MEEDRNYYVYTDRGSGEIKIEHLITREDFLHANSGHYHCVFEGTKEECEKYVEDVEESSKCILLFRDEDWNYYTREYCFGDGSIEEQKASKFDTFIDEFSSEEEVDKYLEEIG